MVRRLLTDHIFGFLSPIPVASGSNPLSAKLSLRVGESIAPCNSRRMNHEMRSYRSGKDIPLLKKE